MPNCPVCLSELETLRQHEGLYYLCSKCQGRAVTFSQIRRVSGDPIATKLLRLARRAAANAARGCPFCSKPMLLMSAVDPPFSAEFCRTCAVVWFDKPTYDSLPQLKVETSNSIQLEATELLAMEKLKQCKQWQQEEEKKARRRTFRRIAGTGNLLDD